MAKHNLRRRMVSCMRCGVTKLYEARGMCKCCYNHVREGRCGSDCLDNYPTLDKWSDKMLERLSVVGDAERMRRRMDPGYINPKKEK